MNLNKLTGQTTQTHRRNISDTRLFMFQTAELNKNRKTTRNMNMTSNNDTNFSLPGLKSLAEQGDMQAQFALGLYYSTEIEGLSCKTEEGWEFKDKLFQEYILELIGGKTIDPKIFSAFALAEKNKEINDEKAFEWFKKAAKLGSSESEYATALCYYEGKGVVQNDKFAFEWAKKSADQNFSEAFCLLGNLYRDGRGVEQNDKRALEYYEKAVADGVINARPKKRDMLLTGKGIENYDERRKAIKDYINDVSNKLTRGANHLVETLEEKCPLNNNDEDPFEDFLKWLNESSESLTGLLKNSSLAAIDNDELSNELKKALESEIKQKENANHRMQKLVDQFTHTLGNVIFPDTIYQVAERLKNNPECRKDVLLLHEAYHSEIIIQLQGELLRQRYANTNPEKFRQLIRRCRRTSRDIDNYKSIEDILDYAASRVTARFLNQHYAGLNSIRDKILSKKNVSLSDLKQKFEDDILLNKSLRPIAWINENLRPVKITEISPLWKKVFILSESHAEALLFGYFSEILFNVFKYADHDKDEFLRLVFDEKTINDTTYLSCSWGNPVKDKAPSIPDSGKGLDAIQEDLKQLNDTEIPEESLLISQQKNQFQVTLFFKKDLLVNELPILKIKRKANTG